jgi:hypothetical protein
MRKYEDLPQDVREQAERIGRAQGAEPAEVERQFDMAQAAIHRKPSRNDSVLTRGMRLARR